MNFKDKIVNQINESSEVISDMVYNCSDIIESVSKLMIKAINKGNKIMWCGNGGSAAQAQHLSAELVGGLNYKKNSPVPSISLTTDSSFLTAWTNDTDFITVFSRQVLALGLKGDILIGLTTSGNSTNIINSIDIANEMGINTIVFTGKNEGKIKGKSKFTISIPSNDTQRIQEGHILCGHIICDLVENNK